MNQVSSDVCIGVRQYRSNWSGVVRSAALLALFGVNAVAVQAQQVLQGVFALQGQTAQTEAHLKATPAPGNPLKQKLDFWMTEPNRAAPIKSYQTEMTKKMHVVVVSNDFKTFMHLHPTLGPDGHLVLTQVFPAKGTYLVYTDGLPNQLNHQVFRFALNVGGTSSDVRTLPPTGMGVQVGPYEVDLSSVRLRSGAMSMVDINILKDGKPATDLHPYLGSPAHAVFLNTKDLSYVHAHPMASDQMMMDMSKDPPPMPENGPSPSDMMLHLALREPGTYKLWLQFHGGTQLYVAEFTITAL
ncbi:hypothetical protein FTO74_07745 [Granulicella sp. WH15]|uniref:hypothetical protein n=1 Tax=Granulicella sp. WH15 TaxID=2602070 RepID=UPI00136719CB|nr:hypothetical protein [Granulicella sp. WH15]QHN03270.1 hypothetical protein FTO74_07745 [Granulicella sp. WH15]